MRHSKSNSCLYQDKDFVRGCLNLWYLKAYVIIVAQFIEGLRNLSKDEGDECQRTILSELRSVTSRSLHSNELVHSKWS